jgi:hypothetical protein
MAKPVKVLVEVAAEVGRLRRVVEETVVPVSSLSLTQPNKYLKNSYEYSER